MSEPTKQEKEQTKERIRAAMDVFENYIAADGRIDATAMTKHIRELKADNERLRREMLDASTQTCSTIFGKPYSEWKALEADNSRLRAALELAMDELTGEAWLAADMALKGAES